MQQIATLREAVRYTGRRHPFEIVAWVVLPEDLHTIWTLPRGDADYATRWRLIKSSFSRGIAGGERKSKSRVSKGERGIWQRRYWEHTIRDERDLAAHFDYVHFNPVKHGLVSRAKEWPHSTFHRCVRWGHPLKNWGQGARGSLGGCGVQREFYS